MKNTLIEEIATERFWLMHRDGLLNHIRTGFQPGCDIQLLEVYLQGFRAGAEPLVQQQIKKRDATTS